MSSPEPSGMAVPGPSPARWDFLTNHAHVLLCLAYAPEACLRDMAVRIGITERAVQRIVSELVHSGFVTRTRIGRRNHYQIHRDRMMALPIGRERPIGDLMAMVLADTPV